MPSFRRLALDVDGRVPYPRDFSDDLLVNGIDGWSAPIVGYRGHDRGLTRACGAEIERDRVQVQGR